MSSTNGVVRSTLRVIYGDTDQMGVAYYANYLRWFEMGRTELLRARGARYRDVEERHGVALPVVQAHADYKSPARYDDELTIETALGALGRASVRFEYRVLRGADLLATGHTIHACIGRDGKVQRLPDEVRALLMAAP